MARKDDNPARFDTLHELITRAEALNLHVTVNVHNVPSEDLMEWLQLGLLDGIEQGAGNGKHRNPPTGVMESGRHFQGLVDVSAFMEDDRERARRIKRQEDELLASLAGEEEAS